MLNSSSNAIVETFTISGFTFDLTRIKKLEFDLIIEGLSFSALNQPNIAVLPKKEEVLLSPVKKYDFRPRAASFSSKQETNNITASYLVGSQKTTEKSRKERELSFIGKDEANFVDIADLEDVEIVKELFKTGDNKKSKEEEI